MTPRDQQDAAIAGAMANVMQKTARCEEADAASLRVMAILVRQQARMAEREKARRHAYRMHAAAIDEWVQLVGESLVPAAEAGPPLSPPAAYDGHTWCAGDAPPPAADTPETTETPQ